MPVKYFVQRGRVALINQGPYAGKLCAIIDIIDQNRALVSGPLTGVPRQPISFKMMRLTRFLLPDTHPTISDKRLKLKWEKDNIGDQFAQTKAGSRLAAKSKKARMTDFDRFKLYRIKQRMNKLINKKTERLCAAEKKKRKEARKPTKQATAKK